MVPPAANIKVVLENWLRADEQVYAVVLSSGREQSCTGIVQRIDDDAVLIGNDRVQVRIPLRCAAETEIVFQEDRPRSITLAWPDGSAFVVTR